MTLDRYLANSRAWETLILLALVGISFFANVGVGIIDLSREGALAEPARPWLLEGTSHAAMLVMFPVVLWLDARCPLRLSNWRRALPAHVGFSVIYALGHVGLLYLGRVALFPSILGRSYGWDNWWSEFGYEYLKDFRTYMLMLACIYLYRFIVLRLRGEAGFVGESDEAPVETPADRFVVKKLGREFLVKVADIEWIESAGNYVNLHVAGKVYPLRGTMAAIAEQLAPRGFVRVHRQAIVNLERVREIHVFDSGDGTLTLDTEALVPISRRYRQSLNEQVRSDPATFH
ncbi:MAG: LytTR family DNA-binding domain-containing protein [Pseudomonadota bacterium]